MRTITDKERLDFILSRARLEGHSTAKGYRHIIYLPVLQGPENEMRAIIDGCIRKSDSDAQWAKEGRQT